MTPALSPWVWTASNSPSRATATVRSRRWCTSASRRTVTSRIRDLPYRLSPSSYSPRGDSSATWRLGGELPMSIDRDVDDRIERPVELGVARLFERLRHARQQLRARSTGHEDTVAEAEPAFVLTVEPVQLGRDRVSRACRLGGETLRFLGAVALLPERHLGHGRGWRSQPRVGVDELHLQRLRQRMRYLPSPPEQRLVVREWPHGGETVQEARRPFEERRDGGHELGRRRGVRRHQPPASRTRRWRIRADTTRR